MASFFGIKGCNTHARSNNLAIKFVLNVNSALHIQARNRRDMSFTYTVCFGNDDTGGTAESDGSLHTREIGREGEGG